MSLTIDCPVNEPVLSYPVGAAQSLQLQKCISDMAAQQVEIPCFIGGKQIFTGVKKNVVMPHDHAHVLAQFHIAGESQIQEAICAAQTAKPMWESLPWEERSAIFLRAADLLAGKYRDLLNASSMLGQSKNAFQAEIDAACELIDFFRFNVYFYQEIIKVQPLSVPGVTNRTDYRPLEGFVAAVTPFNFTSIAANLAAAPALLGNTVVWKPSDTQMLSAYYTMQLLQEAGLPPGVINLVGADGPTFGKCIVEHRDLSGIHFTGSTATFQRLWQGVGKNIQNYRSYPRLVGETGGKDFIFAHASADVDMLVTALIRGAFEYQGQKCSAASRAYIPAALWKKVQPKLLTEIATIRMGDVREFDCFMNAVIDAQSFQRISGYLTHAKNSSDAKILAGGGVQGERGYFVEPTLIQAMTPSYQSMVQEIFGPVLTVFIYEENQMSEMVQACDQSTPYALTGAIFAQDRYAVAALSQQLRNAAGNFYINDKPTGAVVGQQPFGGARASGTNDKAGSALNLQRWLSPRSIKENRVPPVNYRYF